MDWTKTLPVEPSAPAGGVRSDVIGRNLGRFKVIDRLGSGGSADVFRANDLTLGRSVVIKVLRQQAQTQDRPLERFLREIKLASSLDHPYGAHIYGFGVEPDQVVWVAMEHVRGTTLDAIVLERGPMPPAVFAPLFARLCEVVHSAHELGIVHRDIKGKNVMVIERSGQLLPKLLDFGIAKVIAASEAGVSTDDVIDDEGLTLDGTSMGTPLFMSPEQWQDAGQVDGRADIYALGVLGFYCLSGRFPFEHKNRLALKAAHVDEPPPRLSRVPAALADVIERALAKSRDDRWPNALAFSDAIRLAIGADRETVPVFEPPEAWIETGPQPIADALVRIAATTTTIEADAALRELVAITCRWLAIIALSTVTAKTAAIHDIARKALSSDASFPWLQLARAVIEGSPAAAKILSVVGGDLLAGLAERLDRRDPARTSSALATDLADVATVLRDLEPLLRYRLVVGRTGGAESWHGPRRRERENVIVWDALDHGDVALIDESAHVVARLSPYVQVVQPLPSLEPELFLLWRVEQRSARLIAAPWGFEHDDAAVGERLAELTAESRPSASSLGARSPYLGLSAYGVGDADRFVGREQEIEALVNRLVRAPMVAVLGASGVGKSSFIHAGLLPRFAEQHRIITIRPGRHPMHALATAISSDRDRDAVIAKLRQLGQAARRGVVVVVDQLEELATLCDDHDERRQFAESIAGAADRSSARVRVVVTLRADFASVLEGAPSIRGKFEVFVLANPPREGLRKILVEPAQRAGVEIAPQVVDDVLAEIAGAPAALPLLSFVATRLWETRDRGTREIAHAAYSALGGVGGALSAYADQVYSALQPRDQETVRDVFSRLVAADGTRIPAGRAELEQLAGARTVIGHLIEARLLVAREDSEGDTVEIIHECLAERWPRLARWRTEDAAGRALVADVSVAARRWNEQARSPELLWRGTALEQLRALARGSALTEIEREFAAASDRMSRRARTIRRGTISAAIAILAILAAVMAYLGVAARRGATTARDAAQLAEDQLTASLIEQGRRELVGGRSMPALAYLAAAMRRGADGSGIRLMVSVASRGWRDQLVTRDGAWSVTTAVDGTWIAAGSASGVIHLWSPEGAVIGELDATTGPIAHVSAGPGDRLAVAGARGLAVIDVRARRVIARAALDDQYWAVHLGPGDDEITVLLKRHGVVVLGFDGNTRRALEARFTGTTKPVFDAGGRHLFAFESGTLTTIDLVTMARREITRTAASQPVASADRTARGYIDRSGAIHLLDAEGNLVRTIATVGHPDRLAFAPSGDRIAIAIGREVDVYSIDGMLERHLAIDDHALLAIRGDQTWTADRFGVVRHYQGADLVASTPAHVAKIDSIEIAGDTIVTLGNDSRLSIVRASAVHVRDLESPCVGMQRGVVGSGMVHSCATEGIRIYAGNRPIAAFPDKRLVFDIAIDDATGRVAFTSDAGVYLYEGQRRVAEMPPAESPIAIAFSDPEHLVITRGDGVWRWSPPDRLALVIATRKASAVAVAAGGVVIGENSGHVELVASGRSIARLDLGERIRHLAVSPDRRWVVASLGSGAAAVIDGTTGELVRMMETTGHSGTSGAAATFDRTGDLILRAGNNLSIWDRARGQRLVSDLDLFGNSMTGRFRGDGTLELAGAINGLLDIARDDRPASAIVRDIECRVPLRATGDRIEPVALPDCTR